MNAKSMSTSEQQIYNYTVIFEKESDGGYHAFCPALKGCHSQGDNFEEALANKVSSHTEWLVSATHKKAFKGMAIGANEISG